MTNISAAYLLILLPLLSSLLCQILAKKIIPFFIALVTAASAILLALKLYLQISTTSIIANDFWLFPLSIGLEFKISAVSIIFLIAIISLKILILFYYKQDVAKFLNEKNNRIFYSVFCLRLFAIIGILTTNNLLNLFLFLEIYFVSFLAIFSISKDQKISQLSFHYFCLNAAASMVMLFCFLIIYLIFGSLNFDLIKENLLLAQNKTLLRALAILLLPCVIIKFFPFFLYFKNLKNTNLFANFFVVDTLFIKANIGFFIILKFYYLFFTKVSISLILILFAIALSIYSAFRIFQNKHFKIVAINFCLNNFAFILICLALKSQQSLQAAFFYLLNFNLISFFLFIFATFLKRKFGTSLIDRIGLIVDLKQFSGNNLLLLPLKLITIFIAAFPFTFLFYGNWNLSLASLQSTGFLQYNFAIFISPFIIVSLIISQFALFIFAIKITLTSFTKTTKNDKVINSLDPRKYWFHLLSFLFIIVIIYALIFNSYFLNELSIKFADSVLLNY